MRQSVTPNAQRSHAGPVTRECKPDARPALADATGWPIFSLRLRKLREQIINKLLAPDAAIALKNLNLNRLVCEHLDLVAPARNSRLNHNGILAHTAKGVKDFRLLELVEQSENEMWRLAHSLQCGSWPTQKLSGGGPPSHDWKQDAHTAIR